MTEPLRIQKVAFLKSLRVRSRTPIAPRPEIAIAGKSNSGKSSLINYLTGRKRLAYVGKQPGKTRLVNYFVINDSFYLVDLPGYGYAKVSKSELTAWSTMMDSFFQDSSGFLRGILICTDIRRDPSLQDVQMVEWAQYYKIPCIVAATKSDKIGKSRRPQCASRIASFIRDHLVTPAEIPVYPVSSTDHIGGESILEAMAGMLDGGAG